MLQRIQQVVRSLAHRPGFSLLVILIMGLCIGGSASVFSASKAVLLQQLPYGTRDSSRLVVLTWIYRLDGITNDMGYAELMDWKRRATTLEELSPFLPWGTRTLTEGETPERLGVNFASPGYFQLLGVRPQIGRLFTAEEDGNPGNAPVVVITDDVWARRYGRDPQIIGRSIQLSGMPYQVVGVMPAGFWDTSEREWKVDAWVPASMAGQAFPLTPNFYDNRSARLWIGLARIKPGIPYEQAQQEIEAIAAQMEKEFPDSNKDYTARLIPVREFIFGDNYPGLKILFAAAILVLLIGCINVANLMLVWQAENQDQLALHLALGSSRGRLAGLVLTEGLILAAAGGLLGIILSHWGIRLFSSLMSLPSSVQLHLDGGVLAFAVLVTLLTGLLFSLPSALTVFWMETKGTLGRRGFGSARVHSSRSRSGLVILQTAVVVALLVVAGLLVRSFERVRSAPLGFETAGILSFQMVFETARYNDRPNISTALTEILRTVREIPGVEHAAAWGSGPPAIETQYTFIAPEGAPEDQEMMRVLLYSISPGALDLLHVPLLRGRDFNADDNLSTPRAAMVTEALANKLWPGQDPLGKRLHRDRDPEVWATIVGLLPDTRFQGRFSDEGYNLVFNSQQWCFRPAVLLVKTSADSAEITQRIREAVAKVDRQVPVFGVASLDEQLRHEEIGFRRNATVIGIYAVLALAFSVLGLYGMLAYSVAQRKREIGVRMALGADRGTLLGLVMRRGLLLAGTGLVLGLLTAFVLSHYLSGVLYGVSDRDLLTFGAVAAIFLAVASLATYLPARSATKVEPMRALRLE